MPFREPAPARFLNALVEYRHCSSTVMRAQGSACGTFFSWLRARTIFARMTPMLRLLLFLGVLGLGCGEPTQPQRDAGPPPPDDEPGILPTSPSDLLVLQSERECTTSSDCLLAVAGCCTCGTGGGSLTAINRQFEAAVDGRRDQACEGIGCFLIVSSDPTCCALSAECAEGVCEVFGFSDRSAVFDCVPPPYPPSDWP